MRKPAKKKKKGAWNKRYNKKVVPFFKLALMRAGGGVAPSCEYMGITTTTFYRWRDKYPEFKEMIVELKETRVDAVESATYDNALNGNFPAQKFILTNKRPDEWNEKKTIKHDGKVEVVTEEGKETLEGIKIKVEKLKKKLDERK